MEIWGKNKESVTLAQPGLWGLFECICDAESKYDNKKMNFEFLIKFQNKKKIIKKKKRFV